MQRTKQNPGNNDFDLDEYLEAKASGAETEDYGLPNREEHKPTLKRNLLAIGVFLVAQHYGVLLEVRLAFLVLAMASKLKLPKFFRRYLLFQICPKLHLSPCQNTQKLKVHI